MPGKYLQIPQKVADFFTQNIVFRDKAAEDL